MRISSFALAALFALSFTPSAIAQAPSPEVTSGSVIAAAPARAWKAVAAEDLLVMTLAGNQRVVIQLAPHFSQGHVGNMRVLAKAHWWDGTSVYRVQDNYVAQWGTGRKRSLCRRG